ncbi:MAG: hypothetical protein GY884_08075, partial [Proteobacteria bacterium]|nr:hypothetical protein [Pseudomonadota bacterium]
TSPCPELRELRQDLDAVFDDTPLARQLFYASTVMHVSERAEPILASGRDVVVDRYLLTTLAYAEVRGPSLRLRELQAELRVPDVTVFLDCADEVRAARMNGRGLTTDDDRRSLEASRLLRAVYRRLLHEPSLVGVCLTIDASGSAGEVLERTLLHLRPDPGRNPPARPSVAGRA